MTGEIHLEAKYSQLHAAFVVSILFLYYVKLCIKSFYLFFFDYRCSEEVLSPRAGSLIPLTGDQSADKDIIAFYKARQKLIDRTTNK